MLDHKLSAHEHRIATMVADGASNRTIGDGLGVSTRAIEHHLTRVYRKLGISGRRQVSAALAAG
ncbi:helix-turn-helix domain-containing protein [Actinokineospora inagensis]|uniref:helix-turn-helix domain-containing protein n=1 Tax=Actinokineospora inagensis TaxID=103730 RepID=UPI000425402C|nr:helix-turn-helix transcriptional regulator [Actinokineospora inagensis]